MQFVIRNLQFPFLHFKLLFNTPLFESYYLRICAVLAPYLVRINVTLFAWCKYFLVAYIEQVSKLVPENNRNFKLLFVFHASHKIIIPCPLLAVEIQYLFYLI